MDLEQLALTVSTFAYFGAGVLGWVIGILASRTRRYRPAMTYAGLAIGILPVFLLGYRAIDAMGLVEEPHSVTLVLSFMVASLATLWFTFLAMLSVRAETREPRLETFRRPRVG